MKYFFEGIEGDMNLNSLYRELNVKYFSGSLPNIKCKWNGKLKKCVGRATVIYKGIAAHNSLLNKFMAGYDAPNPNIEIDRSSMKIDIATGFDLTENDLISVMLHEMAHILLYDMKIVTSPHHGSPKFVHEINRLRSESGLNIVYKESEYKASPKLQPKTRVAVLFSQPDGRSGISIFKVDFVKKDPYGFNTLHLSIISKSSKIREAVYYLYTGITFNSHPVLRTIKGLSWVIISDDQAKEVRENGKRFGYCTKTEAEIDPGILGSNLEKKIETTKREFKGLHAFLKSDDVAKAAQAAKERGLNNLIGVLGLK